MKTIKKFTGLNNIDRPHDAGPGDLQVATNVTIDNRGVIASRPGSALAFNVPTKNLNADSQSLVFVSGTSLVTGASATPTTLVSGLPQGAEMAYCWLNSILYFSNGTESGTLHGGNIIMSWGIAPPPAPAVYPGEGQLPPGEYQVALTYVRSDGQESAPTAPVTCIVTAGGINVTGFSPSADTSIVGIYVYCTGVGGEVMRNGHGLRGVMVVPNNQAGSITVRNLPQGSKCQTFNTQPMPSGSAIAFYRGRMFVAKGNTLWYSLPWMYEHVDISTGNVMFEGDVIDILPTENGIWVTTTVGAYFLAGRNPDLEGGFDVRAKTKHRCYKGGILTTRDKINPRELSGLSRAVWVSDDGVFVGDNSGALFGYTSKKWKPPVGAGIFGVVAHIGTSAQYVFGVDAGAENKVYAMNLASGAVCEWVGVTIDSLAILDGIVYISSASGLSILSGTTDGASPIQFIVEKQDVDFGDEKEKSVTEVYANGTASGVLTVTVSSEGRTGVYTTNSITSPYEKGHKAHGPRGIKGKNFTFNIANAGLATMSLASIDIDVWSGKRHSR